MRYLQLVLALGFVILMASCKSGFKKFGEKGHEVKIIRGGKGDTIKNGNYIMVHVYASKNDSAMNSTRKKGGPQMVKLDSTQGVPREYITLFTQMRKGDSAVVRHRGDSILKYFPEAKGQVKKTDIYYQNFYIQNIYKDSASAMEGQKAMLEQYRSIDSLANIAQIKEDSIKSSKQTSKDVVVLEKHFDKLKIKPTKVEDGVYLLETTKGDGVNNLKDSMVAMVRYTGKLLNDTIFDSNNNPAFPQNTALLPVQAQPGGMIPGFLAGIKAMSKGSKGTIFMASSKGYGPSGNQKIPANASLAFDIEVVDIITMAETQKIMQAEGAKRKAIEDAQATQEKQMSGQNPNARMR